MLALDYSIQEQNQLIQVSQSEVRRIAVNLDNTRRKLRHKNLQLMSLKKKLGNTQSTVNINNYAGKILTSTAKKRRMKPTAEHLNPRAKITRRSETINACMAIHGATDTNIKPAIDVMLDTLSSKCKSNDLADRILNSKSSVVRAVKKKVLSKWSAEFYKSRDNLLRSLNVYYSHNVMGKMKYLNIRKANKSTSFQDNKAVNFVPYISLADFINEIDIGNIYDVNTLLVDGGVDSDVKGVDRNPKEYILRFAEFYLNIDQHRIDKLRTFVYFRKKDQESFLFVLAIGGNGAPGSGTSFLVSFLNVAQRIASSAENFLLFGANVEETSRLIRAFVLKLVADIKCLESQVFKIASIKVEFKFDELPNDMKILAFLAGELTNSATYFSTFANVNNKDCTNYKKTFGTTSSNEWTPWKYNKRLDDAKKVNDKKTEIVKSKVCTGTQRNKITTFISTCLKSRQEEIPIVGSFVDRAKSEPLHIKNNTIKELYSKLLLISTSQSEFKNAKCFKDVPTDSIFFKFVSFIHDNMMCNFLSIKIKKWFNESGGKSEKVFSFRFQGKESYLYMRHFAELIYMLVNNVNTERVRLRLHEVFYRSPSICEKFFLTLFA